MPFDYLVDCGVNRELIFYVFNELDLRLPDTFNVSGIIPYTPESYIKSQQSSLMPPPPIPDKQRRESIESTVSAVVNASPKAAHSAPAPVTSASTLESPLTTDLHDMERQRRQELKARKAAVQASRRMKQSLSANSSTDITRASDPIPVVPTETVEDFLKSLGSVQTKETSITIVSSPKAEEEAPVMDVDQVQQLATTEQVPQQQEQKPDSISVSSAVSEQFSTSSTRSYSGETPPTSVGSSTTSFPQSSGSTPGTPVIFTSVATRRGLKRPVASDFVDVDPAPKRHESSNRTLQTNGAVRPVGITRRLNSGSGFSNIGSRRCVIDLSDSEDDGEEVHQQPPDDQLKLPKVAPHPSPAPIKPVVASPMSPGALMQKEMEIRKMRELIAQREEETRLRKLVVSCSRILQISPC